MFSHRLIQTEGLNEGGTTPGRERDISCISRYEQTQTFLRKTASVVMLSALSSEILDAMGQKKSREKCSSTLTRATVQRVSVLKSCRPHRIPASSPQRENKVERFPPDKVTVAALIYPPPRPKGDNSPRPSIC